MRARTTWNRESIKQASAKNAEDPRAMNQDHLSQQPKADAYVNGDPSSWAEDVHKPNTWDVEYAGGATKRDEIGMPEKRPETYTHPEKTAAMEEKRLTKKADFTVKLAKLMLGSGAAEAAVEDQAVALMHMPDEALITTYNTLSEKLADQSQFPGGQYPTAEQQQQAAQQQIAQMQQQAQQAIQAGDFEQAKQAIEQCMAQQQGQGQGKQQQVMAGQKKADGSVATPAIAPAPVSPPAQAPAPKAPAPTAAPVLSPDMQAVVQAAVTAALKQAGIVRADDQQQGQQGQGQQQQASQQGQGQGQQQQQAGQQQQDQQQQAAQQQVQMQQQSDDALLDELMMGPGQGGGMGESDIELEAPSMDTGEVVLGPEDDVLKTLFANEETQAAEQAQQGQQDQGQQKQAGMGRTASTRTVGTKPTGGVSRVGGASGASAPSGRGGNEIDKLAALWPSAPDVRGAFNMNS